ncbi:uncharacterized protein VTP21DRAFT_3813 [Calcarisporiella thermophila]|uniref:uncharacterized protein n=1 Tax=Calcarisporiella thermophila TaxID=911321 RepID=UPI00374395BC
MDYSYYINEKGKSRKMSAIRETAAYVNLPGMISMAGGFPNPEMFPFSGLTIHLKDGTSIPLDDATIKETLQYGLSSGMERLNTWLRDLQLHEHKPPRQDFTVSIGTGSQDLITKAIDLLIDNGDSLLLENPSYAGILTFVQVLKCNLVEINTDANGLIPSHLRETLSNWPSDKPRPKVLYTIPTGSNPTGCSHTLERKQEIYAIAREYSLLILEDDPYYYLQFNDRRTPSYFSLDVDGRVLRFDSFSKILSAGLRLGFASGPKELIDKINIATGCSNLHPSGVPQSVAYALLSNWGIGRFLEHTESVAKFYRARCELFLSKCEQHLAGLARWNKPSAGMFLWVQVLGVEDTRELVKKKALEKKVLAVPGEAFIPNTRPSPYLRLSFSTIQEAQMDEALSRLAELLREATREHGASAN